MRDFHATPELCPPPAASADIARRRLLTAVAAAPVIAAAFPASAERRSDDGDAPLFEMSRRLSEIEAEIDGLVRESGRRADAMPAVKWSPEELAQHRIVGAHDAPRWVTESELNDSDWRDKPPINDFDFVESNDGASARQVLTLTRRAPDETETAVWRERCAARRALYDEKKAAHDEAKAASGIEKIENMQAELCDEIYKILDKVAAYQPKTVSGVVEKMRIFRNEHADIFSGPAEELDLSARVFLSALADFERLASL